MKSRFQIEDQQENNLLPYFTPDTQVEDKKRDNSDLACRVEDDNDSDREKPTLKAVKSVTTFKSR